MSVVSLATLARTCFWLGATSFGGPAAHLAVMRRELVERRGWLDEARFLDLIGAANLIPGPTSTEVVMHIGHEQHGQRGLWIAGVAFIAPAVVLTLGMAVLYGRYGALPEADAALRGVKPVVVAVVVHALVVLGRSAVRSLPLALLGAVAVGLLGAGAPELGVLLGAGAFMVVVRVGVRGAAVLPAALPVAAAPAALGAGAIFLTFLKIGTVLFGSGYVLFAFLQAELVERRGWLRPEALLDAIAVGQLTPGPLFSSATFVGYVIGGFPGAAAATAGIFLPAFVLVGATAPILPRLRASPIAGPFLDGVNVASLGLMVVVTYELGAASFVDLPSLLLGVGAVVLLARTRLNSAWLILAGAVVGAVAYR